MALLLLLACLFVPVHAQHCQASIEGHVEDTDTREKLASATVTLSDTLGGKQVFLMQVTNGSGDFRFMSVCPGTYLLRVSHIHCDTLYRVIQVEDSLHLDLYLPHEKKTLSDVLVLGTVAGSGVDRTTLSGRRLEEYRGLSLSEALSAMPGITLLQTGNNIAKPMVNGLQGNRVVMVNNGIRQEGQQWGNEHAPEIDPFIAEKFSLLRGVEALRYGSDAIAGVIRVEPRALRNDSLVHVSAQAGYFTNNRMFVVSALQERSLGRQRQLAYRLQGTWRRGANSATPDYRLDNTGLAESNFSVTVSYKRKKTQSELYVSQFRTRVGIFTGSHIGNISDLLNAIAAPRPDSVFLGQHTYRIGRPSQAVVHRLMKWNTLTDAWGGRLRLLLSAQQNHRQEYDVVRNPDNTRPQMDLFIQTAAEELSWESQEGRTGRQTLGLSGLQQQNVYSGRYFIPNYTAWGLGAYTFRKWQLTHWDLQAGARIDHKSISTLRLRYDGDTFDYSFRFTTWASTFAVTHSPARWHDLRIGFLLGYASRAPQVNELLSDGIHHGTATYEKGDIRLRPEKALSARMDLHWQDHDHRFIAELSPHVSVIDDFIYQQPVPDSPVLTNAGAFPLWIYRQTDALLRGLDLRLTYQPRPGLQLEGSYIMLRASQRKPKDWLILMPADRLKGRAALSLNDRGRWKSNELSLEGLYVFRQTRVPDGNGQPTDYAAPPPGYALFALNLSTRLAWSGQSLTLSLSVRNLLNRSYRDYLNQFRYFTDEMGRNMSLRLQYSLHYKPKTR